MATPREPFQFKLVEFLAVSSVILGSFSNPVVAQSCLPPAPQVVAWWPGEDSANDIVGGNHGALINDATFAAGTVGRAFILDGAGDHVHFGDVLNGIGVPFSIDAWILTPGVPNTYIFRSDESTTNYFGFWFQIGSNRTIAISYGDGGSQAPENRQTKRSSQAIVANTWTHVAAVVRGPADMSLYINGVDAGGTYSGGGGPMLRNADPARLGTAFPGMIDELRIYDRALDPNEVASIHSAGGSGMCRPPGVCGDGIREGSEECDGSDLGGQTCATIGAGDGSLGCLGTCSFNAVACSDNPCSGPPPDLSGWWPGNGTPDDVIGGAPGTLVNGASLAGGFVGEAFSLDGVNDHANFGDILNFVTVPFTIEGWIRAAAADGGVFSSDDGNGNYYGFWLTIQNQRLAVSYGDGQGAGPNDRRSKFSDAIVPLNTWVHVAAVVRGQRDMTLYLNAEDASGYYDGSGATMVHSPDPARLGVRTRWGPSYFSGLVDELGVYTRALSQNELRSIYSSGAAGKCLPPPCQAEMCDGLDNDCDGVVPANEADVDGDGFRICQGDCDDNQSAVNPGALEVCDNLDNNCDGLTDEGCDQDGDGYCTTAPGPLPACLNGGGDCNDGDPSVRPGAPEICDKIDNDCNGLADPADPGGIDDPAVDTDGDGLYDCWELYGIDGDSSTPGIPAPQDVDLALHLDPYSADRLTRDLFVEVDWMVGPGHSHEPFQESLDRVANSFWANSITSTGEHRPITIHWLMSEAIVEDSNTLAIDNRVEHNILQYGEECNVGDSDPGCFPDPTVLCDPGNQGYFGSPADRSSVNCRGIIRAKSWIHRYIVMVHEITGEGHVGQARDPIAGQCSSSGILVAQGKRDFIVNVADFFGGLFLQEAYDKQAGTIMHELGHTLGLRHGGLKEVYCKPNYISVMNYSRMHKRSGRAQWVPGATDGDNIRIERELNFSSEALPTLGESALWESDGVGSATGGLVLYGVDGEATVGPASGPINWNADLNLDDPLLMTLDINAISIVSKCDGANDPDPNGTPGDSLSSHHDWDRVLSCMRLPDVPVSGGPTMASVVALAFDPNFPDEPTENDYLNGSLGSLDVDSDGVSNTLDLCPLATDPNQENADGDVRGDACDCLQFDAGAWAAPPSETLGLDFVDQQTLAWTGAPDFFGATTVQYDLLRSGVGSNFLTSTTCVESSDGSDMQAIDAGTPSPGQAFFYLVRARNLCPNSEGTLGVASDGTERIGAVCP